MTSKEKEIVAGLVTTLLICVWYLRRLLQELNAGLLAREDQLTLVSQLMVKAILAGVVIQIVLVIAMHIAEGIAHNGNPPAELVDEREEMIVAQTEAWFSWIMGIGFVGGLITFAYGGAGSQTWGLNIMLAGALLSGVIAAVVQMIRLRSV